MYGRQTESLKKNQDSPLGFHCCCQATILYFKSYLSFLSTALWEQHKVQNQLSLTHSRKSSSFMYRIICLYTPTHQTTFVLMAGDYSQEQATYVTAMTHAITAHFCCLEILCSPLKAGCRGWGVEVNKTMREVDQCVIKGHIQRNVPEMFAEQWWVHTLTFHFMLYWLGLSFFFFHSFFLSFFLVPCLLKSCPTGSSRVATCPGAVVALAISPNSVPSSQQCH